jgi:hypothetical protein
MDEAVPPTNDPGAAPSEPAPSEPAPSEPAPSEPAPSGRGTYVVAGLIALVPLLLLGAAAPGGSQWRWLEFPSRMTAIAAALGIAACFARSRAIAVWVLLGSVAGTFLWGLLRAYIGLKSLGRMDLFGEDLPIIVSNTVQLVAPWLVGALYGALAWLAIPRAPEHADRKHTDALRAALWLVVVGVIAIALTTCNRSWLTLENLGERGTFRSSASWPDTKVLSMVVAMLVSVASAAVALRAWRARAAAPALPRATLRK